MAEASQELSALKTSFQSPDLPNYYIWWNPANTILGLGVQALEAEISFASGNVQHAIELLEEAVDLESQLIYDEPPPWSVPSRQLLGRMLFDSQNYEAAREIFLADLEQYPENGWSLFGLYQSLVLLKQTDQAKEVKSRFELAWKTADTQPVVGSF
ncbi:MAG: hypothetical protein O3B41_04890 [Bacteroidetes bacterium]|nr:hypothetical protein [Bacteroidota bacterium]